MGIILKEGTSSCKIFRRWRIHKTVFHLAPEQENVVAVPSSLVVEDGSVASWHRGAPGNSHAASSRHRNAPHTHFQSFSSGCTVVTLISTSIGAVSVREFCTGSITNMAGETCCCAYEIHPRYSKNKSGWGRYTISREIWRFKYFTNVNFSEKICSWKFEIFHVTETLYSIEMFSWNTVETHLVSILERWCLPSSP